MNQLQKEAYEAYKKAVFIYKSELEWDEKYFLIFSQDISKKIFDAYPNFDYYDPDTSYQEDVESFMRAVEYDLLPTMKVLAELN